MEKTIFPIFVSMIIASILIFLLSVEFEINEFDVKKMIRGLLRDGQ
jgi:hypothetical protein